MRTTVFQIVGGSGGPPVGKRCRYQKAWAKTENINAKLMGFFSDSKSSWHF